jgi:molecular chaperone DnaK
MNRKEFVLGIDLGTSNSLACVLLNNEPVIIPSSDQQASRILGKTHPSYVAITPEGEILVGEPARKQILTNPEGTVKNIKRRMGQKIKIKLGNQEFYPEQISAMILKKIKQDAELFLGAPVNKAVITVPAYFNEEQRQATKNAGVIAGLDVLRIINEPTAAALAYGLDKKDKEEKVLVFDLGGGTLDITIMQLSNGIFEVISTSGDTKLGGSDMDIELTKLLLEKLKKKTTYDFDKDIAAYTRIREAVEKAKIELSSLDRTQILIPYIAIENGKPINIDESITKQEFLNKISDILAKIKLPLDQALLDAKLTIKDIDEVILVGGPTKMPAIKSFVEKYMGKSLQYRTLDPMHRVAQGAAIQGRILAGDVKGLVLLDVTPLTLGIETVGGIFSPIISRNSAIPTRKAEKYVPAEAYQKGISLRVFQGERQLVENNTLLGSLDIDITPGPRGRVEIEVTFEINADGLLVVYVKELPNGAVKTLEIKNKDKFSKDQIEAMIKDAELNAEKDKLLKEKKLKEYSLKEAKQILFENKELILEQKREPQEKILFDEIELLEKNENSTTRECDQVKQKAWALIETLKQQKQTQGSQQNSTQDSQNETTITPDEVNK